MSETAYSTKTAISEMKIVIGFLVGFEIYKSKTPLDSSKYLCKSFN